MTRGALVRLAERRGELRWRKLSRRLIQATAIFAVLFATLIVGENVTAWRGRPRSWSPKDRTQMRLRKLAYEAFPDWQASQGDTTCPTIRDLLVWTDLPRDQVRDAWGQPIEIRCGEPLPGSVHGLFLRSAGPDGEFGTGDDVTP